MEAETPRAGARGIARLVIVDDHEVARAGLRSMLEREPDLEVVGEAVTGREAIALCRQLEPDVVLMDVRMPDVDGLSATQVIKARSPRTSVIVVTMHDNPDYLFEALKAGASGYILKDASQRELVRAVRQVIAGETLPRPGRTAELLRRLARKPRPAVAQPAAGLTPRELEVLELVTLGLTNREIAGTLSCSPGTVKVHVEHIIAKLEVSDRTQAAVRAVELGLTSAPPE
ncbi:MAG TPA: response regulator transcription factor [Chloroflexota bacterium]|nr:response regulator transcription factor [Chloroflexota bacterium]